LTSFENDKEYYREFHGFDPEADLIFLPGPPRVFRYETGFPLEQDAFLNRAGVTIYARSEMDAYKIRNRIVFKRAEKESLVDCVHTAVCIFENAAALPPEGEEDTILEQVQSTENHQARLPLAEHFASLKSYVAGIAELGLGNIITTSYQSEELNPMTLPFGFNAQMQAQILRALREVAPSETRALVRDHLVELATSVPRDWFIARLSMLDAIYGFSDTLFDEPQAFEVIDEVLHDPTFRVMAARSGQAHPTILDRIAQDPNDELKQIVAENLHASAETLLELAQSEDHRVRNRVAVHPNLLLDTMKRLANDPQFDVRYHLLWRRDLPADLLTILVGDADPRVRQRVATHLNVTPEIMNRLAHDPDFRVRKAVNRNPGVAPKLKKVTHWENGRPLDHIA
jgi:hypothetical protein